MRPEHIVSLFFFACFCYVALQFPLFVVSSLLGCGLCPGPLIALANLLLGPLPFFALLLGVAIDEAKANSKHVFLCLFLKCGLSYPCWASANGILAVGAAML
ncbi:hypothetical protein U1Q18_017443 [Sarracenia purpurea var. burkii]